MKEQALQASKVNRCAFLSLSSSRFPLLFVYLRRSVQHLALKTKWNCFAPWAGILPKLSLFLLGGVLKQGCIFRGWFLVRLLIPGKYEESALADCTDRIDGEQCAI